MGCNASTQGALRLTKLGFKVKALIGGFEWWKKDGYQTSQTKDGYGNPPFSEWHKQNQQIKLGTFAESAAFGEILINATQGVNSVAALKFADTANLNGKILIDIANPLDFSIGMPPTLLTELSNTHSLGEEIQKTFPMTKVVKTLSTIWRG